MSSLQMSHIDLECGGEYEEEGSDYFSDAEEGSCHSQFYSTTDDYSFACSSEVLDGQDLMMDSSSSVAVDHSECVDLECGICDDDDDDNEVGVERECRICQLSLVSSSPGCGVAIELGCSCKDDLAAAHKHCAETWFKIKGNKTCEICNSVARNVVGPNDIESTQQGSENSSGVTETIASVLAPSSTPETRTCLNGHRFLNFLLACMVFAFIISWLFHFNMPS